LVDHQWRKFPVTDSAHANGKKAAFQGRNSKNRWEMLFFQWRIARVSTLELPP
jgi:hypothetical protein